MIQECVGNKRRKNSSLVEENIGYSQRIARNFYRSRNNLGIDREDFESAALLGLCDAASRYDSSKGGDFKAFAYLRIRGAMLDLLRRTSIIPRYQYYKLYKNDQTGKSEPRQEQIIDDTSFDLPIMFPQVMEILHELGMAIHFAFEDQNFIELSYQRDLSPEDTVIWKSTVGLLQSMIARLTPVERKVINLRYFVGYSFSEMRKKFSGISRSTISRWHFRAIDKLKIMLDDHITACRKRQTIYDA